MPEEAGDASAPSVPRPHVSRALKSRQRPAGAGRGNRPQAPLEADRTALLVPIGDIRPGRNARSNWERMDEALEQLAEHVREQGILEPLLVRELSPDPETRRRRFQLIAGYRRYAVARHLGLPRVPVRVLAASDDEALALNLVENLARGELPETDALRGLQELQETYRWGVRKIARMTGRTPAWVSELLSVARSEPERAAVERGQIGMETAARLVRLRQHHPELRRDLLERIGAGARVQIEDVPRLKALRGTPAAGRDGEAPAVALSADGAAPSLALDIVASPGPPAPPLELGRAEQSLVRNLWLTTRQVLSALHAEWGRQGRERSLPVATRTDLERVRDEVTEFLRAGADSPPGSRRSGLRPGARPLSPARRPASPPSASGNT